MCIPFLARFIGKIRQPLMIHQYSQRGILGWLCPDFIGWVNLGSVDCWLQKHFSLYKNIPAVGRYLYLYLYIYMCLYLCLKSIFWYLRLTMDYGQSTKEHQKSGWRPPLCAGGIIPQAPLKWNLSKECLGEYSWTSGKKRKHEGYSHVYFFWCALSGWWFPTM